MANLKHQPGMKTPRQVRGALLALVVGILLGNSASFAQTPSKESSLKPKGLPAAGETVLARSVEGEPIVEVRVVGNKSMPLDKISPHIRTRANRPFSVQQLQDDARSLDKTRMFVDIKTYTQRVPNGVVVIFDLLERPMLTDVMFVGNDRFSDKQLLKESKLKVGDPVDPFAINQAKRTLEEYYHEKGNDKARITLLEGDKSEDRRAVFLINEGVKQKVQYVSFVGNTIVSAGRLRTQIETAHPILYLFKGELDRKKLDQDVEKLNAYYCGLGFFNVRIGREVTEYDPKEHGSPELLFSRVAREFNQFDTSNWLVVTFIIDEGPRFKVRSLEVKGNTKYGSEELLGDMKLKGGEYFNQDKMNLDVLSLKNKYGGNGYVFSKVDAAPRFLLEGAELDLVYKIQEGARYHVGSVDPVIKGDYPHTKVTTLLDRMSLHPGDIADTREMQKSERRFKASQIYENNPAQGDIPKITYNAPESVEAEEEQAEKKPKAPPHFRGQSPDVFDDAPTPKAPTSSNLVWRSNPVSPSGSPVEQYAASVAAQTAGPASPNVRSESYRAVPPHRNVAEEPVVYRPQYTPSSGGVPSRFQTQLPGLGARKTAYPTNNNTVPNYQNSNTAASGNYPQTQNIAYAPADSSSAPLPPGTSMPPENAPTGTTMGGMSGMPAGTMPANGMPTENVPPGGMANAQAPTGAVSTQQPWQYTAAGAMPAPERPVPSVFRSDSPFMGGPADGGEPTLPLDLKVSATETNTGRFMFGVGVNSDAGLFGSIVIDEQNFDLFRFPRRWDEVKNFTAFRGDGQRLRLEAVPGTQVQRYSASWQVPYLPYSDNSLGVSGYYYSRAFTQWFEQRIGGRVGIGRQLSPDLSGTIAYRGAAVDITDPTALDVPQINAVLGRNALHGFSLQMAHDTRDNTFLATEGHLIDAQIEQVVGTWVYPRAEIDMRKYFMLYERPDQSGRHVLSLTGRVGYTGPDTPIYENYYAGGFSTMRGFAFRGVSPMYLSTNPVVQNVAVGGQFQALASIEYMFPITADDMLRGVVFCDTGTVERSINDLSSQYRVAPGFGLRITVPAMGPAPIALDFAFPVCKNPGDVQEMFSFFVGFGK